MAPRGAIAVAVDFLIAGGETREAAARFVASELRNAGIRESRGDITPRQILRWRDDMGGAAPELAERTYKQGRDRLAKVPPEAIATPKDRRTFVHDMILAIQAAGFQIPKNP
jgi:hypothetical protein